MNSAELPADIVKIAEFLARNAELSGGAMKSNEEAKIKASMMNEPAWWVSARVSPQAFESACREAGLQATLPRSESFCGRFTGAGDLSRTASTGTSSSRSLLSR
ncbi:hypothetical protein ACIBEK_08335 [Nocardia fusca]|uniref:hypothetical protein n=1 Tax=Nocardia fusca TaxID=941183 RepID=UPI00379F642C